jgi:hypothetical protein
MRPYLFIRPTILFVSLALMGWLPALSAQAADDPSGGAPIAGSAGEISVVAVGSVEDTLKACLARIPKDASAGQQMIAEQSCKRDEETRETIQSAPGF